MQHLRKKGKEAEHPRMDLWKDYICKSALIMNVYSVPYEEYPPKSDKVEEIRAHLKSLSLEGKAKKLPKAYHHWPSDNRPNTKIRVDHIPQSAVACWAIAIRDIVGAIGPCLELYFDVESNFCAFLTFPDHDCATRFVENFNNKEIPGTDMKYQLSWAPFYRNLSIMPYYHPDEEEVDEKRKERAKEYMSFWEFIQKLPVNLGMLSSIRTFHRNWKKEAVIKCTGELGIFARRGVKLGPDDGRTTMLCLTKLDPCVEEGFMKSIFEQYGECTVDLPDKEGCGLVNFKERTCAVNAYADLDTLLEDEKVCLLRWGHLDWADRNLRFREHGVGVVEREGLPAGHVRFDETNILEMITFPREQYRRKGKAIATAETSKRPTCAETSKRFQSVRNSVGKIKAKRGRTHY